MASNATNRNEAIKATYSVLHLHQLQHAHISRWRETNGFNRPINGTAILRCAVHFLRLTAGRDRHVVQDNEAVRSLALYYRSLTLMFS